jgi:ADP-ribose pyrophosphatase
MKISYMDPLGAPRTWESAERLTRPKDSEIDGVGIVAVLRHPIAGPSLLLQKQFRPPLDRVTIEVPSGLVDEGESATQAALRELREETGYIGTIAGNDAVAEGFVMWNDPGFCNTNTKMVVVEVDMADPRNQDGNLRSELDESEFIECFTLPLARLWEELTRLDREGFAIDARVATLAQGMEMAKRWKEVLKA